MKTGTGTYGAEIYQQYNLPDSALKTYGLTDLVLNTQCQYGWASKLNNTVLTHLSATSTRISTISFQDVMSDISSKDGEDFKKPKDVNGSDGDNLSVAGHPDNNTTNRSVHGDSDTSSSKFKQRFIIKL